MSLKDDLLKKSSSANVEETTNESVEEELDLSSALSDNAGTSTSNETLLNDLVQEAKEEEPVIEQPVGQYAVEQPQLEQQPEPVYNTPVYEPAPQPQYNTSYSSSGDTNLDANLLSLAKETILNNVVETFTSEIVTKSALSDLVSAYLHRKDSTYTNGKMILVAVIDEIEASDYTHEHYANLVHDILESVKRDLI